MGLLQGLNVSVCDSSLEKKRGTGKSVTDVPDMGAMCFDSVKLDVSCVQGSECPTEARSSTNDEKGQELIEHFILMGLDVVSVVT